MKFNIDSTVRYLYSFQIHFALTPHVHKVRPGVEVLFLSMAGTNQCQQNM